MLKYCKTNVGKTWSKFMVCRDGTVTKYRIIPVTEYLTDDFVEFTMENYVKKELTHQIAGIPYNAKAMNEYRDILKSTVTNPTYLNFICCPEVDGSIMPIIAATQTISLITKRDMNDDILGHTKEVRRFYEIIRDWNNVCSFPSLMEKYGIERIFEYYGVGIHPDYARRGIATELTRIRPELCEKHKVRHCFAWMTSDGTYKAAKRCGWRTEYKIKTEDMAKILNVTFKNPPSFFRLMAFII